MSLDGAKLNSKYLGDGKTNCSSVAQHPKGASQMSTKHMMKEGKVEDAKS